ncbi:hypothetical protein LTT66_02790 [Nocardia gipuzkoensis]|uniref:hypothetical protein n=1 Tax=Nocardia gipuzkoensis TaxID=2749991 RepID=UPI001E3E19A0|nr:hypothetical protein [Nocardia gipuzkoensis]UGT69156.1 hypothetical protein LTT66_02790 [Nocardia gipuzkoensis]
MKLRERPVVVALIYILPHRGTAGLWIENLVQARAIKELSHGLLLTVRAYRH